MTMSYPIASQTATGQPGSDGVELPVKLAGRSLPGVNRGEESPGSAEQGDG